jgi:hypothetical protein
LSKDYDAVVVEYVVDGECLDILRILMAMVVTKTFLFELVIRAFTLVIRHHEGIGYPP